MYSKIPNSDDEGDPAILLEEGPYSSSRHNRSADQEDRLSIEEAGLISNASRPSYASLDSRRQYPLQGVLHRLLVASGAKRTRGSPSLDTKPSFLHPRRCCVRVGFAALAFLLCLGMLQLLSIARGAYIALFPGHRNRVITEWEQIGKSGGPENGLAHYPTDFTRDVLTIPCHSHNDYWRDVPLFSGISAGCISTEADVWLLDNVSSGSSDGSELLVGHDESSLTRNRTLKSLYIDPLLAILDQQNPTTEFADGNRTLNGVFDTDPEQVTTLLIDLKTDGSRTFEAVVKALQPLRERGYLTHIDPSSSELISRPIRVVGTGNTNFELIQSTDQNPHRDIFFDAPIADMSSASSTSSSSSISQAKNIPYGPTNSYYASGSFTDSIGYMLGWSLTSAQLEKLRDQISGAHAAGLKVRYWETPAWPVSRRNALWSILVEEGADVLNVDDLRGAVEEDWRRAGRWWG